MEYSYSFGDDRKSIIVDNPQGELWIDNAIDKALTDELLRNLVNKFMTETNIALKPDQVLPGNLVNVKYGDFAVEFLKWLNQRQIIPNDNFVHKERIKN